MAQNTDAPNNPFILLLNGVYQPLPVGHGPANDLGLSVVDLSDGSYERMHHEARLKVCSGYERRSARGVLRYRYPRGSIVR